MDAGELDLILGLVIEAQEDQFPFHVDLGHQKRAIKTIGYEVLKVLASIKKNHPNPKTSSKVDFYKLHRWITYWTDYWNPSFEMEISSHSKLSHYIAGIKLVGRKIIYVLTWLALFFKNIFKKRAMNYLCFSVKQGGVLEEVKFQLNSPDACPAPFFFMCHIYLRARYILPIFQRMKFIGIRKKFQYKLEKYLGRELSTAENEIIKYFPFEYIYASCTASGKNVKYISDGNYSSNILTRLLLATKNAELIVYQHGNNFLMRGKCLKNTYETDIGVGFIGWGRPSINCANISPSQYSLNGALRTLPELKKKIVSKNISLTIYGCDSSDVFVESWREKVLRREIAMANFMDTFSKQFNLDDEVFVQFKAHPWDGSPRPHLGEFYAKYENKISFGGDKEGLVAASLYDSTICWLRLALNRPTIFIFDDYEDVVPEYREMINKLFELEICFRNESALFKKLRDILKNQDDYINNFLNLDIPKIISPYVVKYF